ncbi:MAG: O-acetylhomoserine aminocarboxypropyltransferase/cysteine synthase, partial [Desulfovibrio sp.]|nr:O-acetylhomoserine aminocarboxypropyltransferase/cysteine synthase [Desulfovibrio sp.]
FVDQNAPSEELEKAFRPNTRCVFGETIANPALTVFDIERFAQLAHAHKVPLIVDNTFATPYLCRPFEWGADIVVHSTTKYLDGHAVQVGGIVVDSGNFDWTNGNFPEFTEPDDSYHGTVYVRDFGKAAFIVKARVQIMRDLGCCQTAQGAFYVNLGIQTLPVRMERHCRSAEKVAAFLEKHPKIEFVNYPGLASSPEHALAQKYLPKGVAGVISFSLKGGREAGARFIDSLRMITLEVHVADIRTCVLHPASSTHRQLTDEQLADCGITPGMVRLSVGLEDPADIIDDLEQAIAKA